MPDFSNLPVRQKLSSCPSTEPFPAPKSLYWNCDVDHFSYHRGQHINTACKTRPETIIESGANFFYVTYVKQRADGLPAIRDITFFATAGGLPSRIKVTMIDPEFEANHPWTLSWIETYDATELKISKTISANKNNGEDPPISDVGSCAVWSAKGTRKPSLTSLCHPYFAKSAQSCLVDAFPFCSGCAALSAPAGSTSCRIPCPIHADNVDAAFPSCSFTAHRSIADEANEAEDQYEVRRYDVETDRAESLAAAGDMDISMDIDS